MSPGLKPAERIKIVLGLMPLEVTAEQIAQATGADATAVEEILAEARGRHALELIARCRKLWESQRADIGSQAKKARAVAEGVQVPDYAHTDWHAEVKLRAAAVEAAVTGKAQRIGKIREGWLKVTGAAAK